ncbi:MAG TPA: NAD(P)/FAD-dependent oxidoreductase [Chloroflexia bacterium]|nr:NAD(P)/FAD-dependent oxidoreductase [Chloroflexia bacterium]
MATTVDEVKSAGEAIGKAPGNGNGNGNGYGRNGKKPDGWESHPEEKRGHRRPRVLIIGAGFGGINAARTLAGKDVNVLILDRNNYHGFWPLLYQVATAALEPESIAYPVRAIFRSSHNVDFQMAEVRSIDLDARIVHTDAAVYSYDYLVLAAGTTNNYFGNPDLAWQTFGLKDIDEAEMLRNRVLYNFEQAVYETNPLRRRELMSFVIIGGGPTGVELAGAFAELINHVLRKDYPMLDMSDARVTLIEASDKILAAFPESLQNAARRKLEEMGVEIRMQSPVESVTGGEIVFKDGSKMPGGTIVWAAGVKAAEIVETIEVAQARGGRVQVAPTLNVPERPEVFVVGDMTYLEGYKDGQAYPMVAPVAIQMGKWAAKNILAQAKGGRMRKFRYFDKGNLATVGRSFAIMDAFGLRLSGRIAWLGWVFVHIMYLVGFRNRLIVLTNWAFNYFNYERGVRLITSRARQLAGQGEPVSRGAR